MIRDNNRNNTMALFRVIATLMVVMVHLGQSLPLPYFLKQIVLRGKYGVVLFYIICGFFAAKSLSKDDNILKYYSKRWNRIAPIYYFNLFVNMLIALTLGEFMVKEIYNWCRYGLFLQSLLPSCDVGLWNNYNALWSMTPIIVFYIFAPSIVKMLKKFATKNSKLIIFLGETVRKLG